MCGWLSILPVVVALACELGVRVRDAEEGHTAGGALAEVRVVTLLDVGGGKDLRSREEANERREQHCVCGTVD